MNETKAFSAPLELTERTRLPTGPMRVVLAMYPSGALSVELVPDAKDGSHPSLMLSADINEASQLPRGEFAAACIAADLAAALLRGGLFRATGKRLGSNEVWSLKGLAMIEFQSAFRPPLAASRVSFPAHLFEDRTLDRDTQKHLIERFETDGYTRHSAQGASVWVIKQHCEQRKIPFTVYLLKEQDDVVGVLACKHAVAAMLEAREAGQGGSIEMVYESPRYST
ncbi:MAG: hypothetical protein ACO1NO_08015 [Burkholderiaceae bacterium]